MKKVTFSNNIPMRWEFFMGYRCYSPCVMWTYPKSALTPISCVQTVAYSVKNHKPWECKNLMQVSFKWLIEPHEIGVWHLQRAKTILYSWAGKSKKLDPPTTPISSVPSIWAEEWFWNQGWFCNQNRMILKPKPMILQPRMILKPKKMILKPRMIPKPRTPGNQKWHGSAIKRCAFLFFSKHQGGSCTIGNL